MIYGTKISVYIMKFINNTIYINLLQVFISKIKNKIFLKY